MINLNFFFNYLNFFDCNFDQLIAIDFIDLNPRIKPSPVVY